MGVIDLGLPDLVEVALIEDQEVLILILETVNGVSDALGEVPDVPIAECLCLLLAILINC